MKLFNAQSLKNLIKPRNGPCISIFIPTHTEWNKKEEDKIRLKNHIQKIINKLREKKYKSDQIKEIFETTYSLIDDVMFWKNPSSGLAMFISPDETLYYRLPIKFKECSELSYRYYIKPMLPLLSGEGRYFIIALDLNESKLFHGSKFSVGQIQLPEETPKSLDEAMKFDDPEKSIQFHTGTGGSRGDRNAVFHGQGTGTDDKLDKKQILRFFQMLNSGVMKEIADENVPLIIIGVDYLIPIYKEANSYPHLFSESIDTNPQDFSADEIHERVWSIIKSYFNQSEEEALEEYGSKKSERLASSKSEEIIEAAFHKRIDKLIVDPDKQIWGSFDEKKNKVVIDSESTVENEDLQDFAILYTIENNGTVFMVNEEKLPGEASMAAIFRYHIN